MRKPDSPSESVLYLVAVAIGWGLLSTVPAGLVVFIFSAADLNQRSPDWPPGVGNPLREAVEFGTYAVLFLAVYIRGRIVGHGDVRAGLGYEPILRRPVVLWMAGLIATYILGLNLYYYEVARYLFYQQLAIDAAAPWLSLYDASKTVLLVPLAEELYLRGWLWTGLRKHWGFLPTATLTGTAWLALHFFVAANAPARLVPVAVILSIARHCGGSVRASIALHILYNCIIVTLPWILKAAGLL
jgi:membrane protease YdiL (CAAX protease family)